MVIFLVKRKPQTNKGVKFAYWTCTLSGHVIKMEMIEKRRARARDHTESVGKILDDLEGEYLNQGNVASVRWKRDNVKQILQRERKKAYPNIPKNS